MNMLIALALTFAAGIASRELFGYRLRGLAVVGLYLLLYGLISWLRSRRAKEEFPEEEAPDRSSWPLSGPLARFGIAGGLAFGCTFTLTNMLGLLNPFQVSQLIRQVIGDERLKKRERRAGNSGINYQNKAQYRLPFRGEWLVFNGGRSPKTSHSWDILGQRFAIDFVQVDEGFQRHTGSGRRLEQYRCYGQEILAAAEGTVVSVEKRVADAPLVGWGICDFMARHFAGNHVIIRHAEGEYGVYAHLIEGSIPVKPGDAVAQGEVIGRCGHSGHSSEPHLHFQLQDSADFFEGMGLPVRFNELLVDRREVGSGYITAGQRVQNASNSSAAAD